jgi:serine/threonine-protein kinase RsbT
MAMPLLKHDTLPIQSETDVVLVRQMVRKWVAELGFSLVDQTKIITAASELARNALIHGGGGTARLEALTEGVRKGIRLAFEDNGPGIPDLDLALRDGYTTGNGLGLGLSGSKRLMTEFNLVSRVGQGTCVTVAKWK